MWRYCFNSPHLFVTTFSVGRVLSHGTNRPIDKLVKICTFMSTWKKNWCFYIVLGMLCSRIIFGDQVLCVSYLMVIRIMYHANHCMNPIHKMHSKSPKQNQLAQHGHKIWFCCTAFYYDVVCMRKCLISK